MKVRAENWCGGKTQQAGGEHWHAQQTGKEQLRGWAGVMSARLLSQEGQDYKMVRIKESNAEKKVNSKKCPTDSKLPIALRLGTG